MKARQGPGCVGLYAGLAPGGALLNRRSKPCSGGWQAFLPLAERPAAAAAAAAAAKPEARGREGPGRAGLRPASGSQNPARGAGERTVRAEVVCREALLPAPVLTRHQQLTAPSLQGARPDPAGLDRREPSFPFPENSRHCLGPHCFRCQIGAVPGSLRDT